MLRAFEALREHIDTELTVIGPTHEELAPMLIDPRGVRALGKVDDERKREALEQADVLCAPSLGSESFGMVLTEAFAAGTTVVASDIAGYRDVVTDDVDGVLVPPADAQALAEALRDISEEPERRREMARAALRDVERFAWPHVADQVMEAYEDAIATPQAGQRRPARGRPDRAASRRPEAARARRGGSPAWNPSCSRDAAAALARSRAAGWRWRRSRSAALVLGCLALNKIGLDHIASALINSSPTFVLLGLAVMCSAMAMRGLSWYAILRASRPPMRVRLADAMQGTMIGVLMSSTLPARLGEPARALVVARRTGRPRENLPIVLGTVVSQTLLNIVALAVLGSVMFSAVDLFSGHQDALLVAAIAPLALLILVLLAPIVLRHGLADSRLGSAARGAGRQARAAMARVRAGLTVFRQPRLGG